MRAINFVLVAIVWPAMFANAQEVAPNCPLDLDGTTRSQGMPSSAITASSMRARTLRDFRNAAVNYYFHDGTGNAARLLLVGMISPGLSQNSVPLCNEIGQCVTASIVPVFTGGISIGGLISIGGSLIQTGYDITVQDEGGNRESFDTGFSQNELVIPSSGPAGLVYQDMTCRQNNHLESEPAGSDSVSNEGSGEETTGGGGGGIGPDPNAPIGYSGVTQYYGGGSGVECWEFTARDQDGNYIGSYIRCF